jgi:multidrug/hemolysin transport system ATP-binding protein
LGKRGTMENIIEISHLSKSYGEIRAVQDLSFHVRKGEMFAFLGENGAGKSTTISILCGLLSKDAGTIRVGGADLDREAGRVKRELGVVFQNSVLDQALSVRDNLMSRAALYGITGGDFRRRLEELTELLSLEELLKRPVGRLSGGQRRRIDIARALLHRPGILVLDEPTTGLDPQTRKTVWQVAAKLREEEGMTIFVTTHYMEEAAEADYVVILDHGKIAAEGTPRALKNAYTGDFITLYGVSEEEVKILGVPGEMYRGAWRILVPDTAAATQLVVSHPEIFRDYEITKGRMDDVFLAVTGKKLAEEEAG